MKDFADFMNWMWVGLWASLLGLLSFVWNGLQRRMAKMERGSAQKEDLERHAKIIAKLFDRVDEHVDEDRAFHRELMTQTHQFHTELIDRLTTLQAETYRELSKKINRKER